MTDSIAEAAKKAWSAHAKGATRDGQAYFLAGFLAGYQSALERQHPDVEDIGAALKATGAGAHDDD